MIEIKTFLIRLFGTSSHLTASLTQRYLWNDINGSTVTA